MIWYKTMLMVNIHLLVYIKLLKENIYLLDIIKFSMKLT